MASTMQLEFSQAMSDFKTMFPEMDRDVIEAVLRANQGAVDATIDQLLAMSTDSQSASNSPTKKTLQGLNTSTATEDATDSRRSPLMVAPTLVASLNTGASPKVKPTAITANVLHASSPTVTPTKSKDVGSSPASSRSTTAGSTKWNPPMLGPLPATFLRLSSGERSELDLPDEQFAIMLQNEEFMNELRWNQEFMLALEKEQQEKGKTEDDAAFKERLRHMGKKSRKKFLQLARVFTWQRNKKPGAVRHPDSLLLQEEHSDEDEPRRTKK